MKSKVTQDEIEQLEVIGWRFTEIKGEGVQVSWPNDYKTKLGMDPNAHTYFSSCESASLWCRGFTQAMQMIE